MNGRRAICRIYYIVLCLSGIVAYAHGIIAACGQEGAVWDVTISCVGCNGSSTPKAAAVALTLVTSHTRNISACWWRSILQHLHTAFSNITNPRGGLCRRSDDHKNHQNHMIQIINHNLRAGRLRGSFAAWTQSNGKLEEEFQRVDVQLVKALFW